MSYTISRGSIIQNSCTEYTAQGAGSKYESLRVFADHVYDWLDKNNISYIWKGEQTSTRGPDAIVTYYLTVSISDIDEGMAVLFALRWA